MECIAKEKLHIILLVDTSKSMGGKRIEQVEQAILDIKDYLINLEDENTNMDFYLSIIPFSNDASFYHNERAISVKDFKFDGIKTGGWSNLHLAYEKLGEILKKEADGGIMPDFGGAAPIILLLSDGHPTGKKYKEALKEIENSRWYRAALRYGIAIELGDKLTIDVLRDFAGKNGDVIKCYNASMLKDIIKIIVLTASEVKSRSSNVSFDMKNKGSSNQELQQVIAEKLSDTSDWEW